MKSNLLISVVMPVYNSERYLEKAVGSITKQTLGSVEIICVNDKSTDDSLDILRNLQKKDKRIKIINNKINVGPGGSRNIGIKNARGKYICFLDSDDWLEENACEVLYKKAEKENADVVCIRPKLVFADKVILDNRLLTEKDTCDKHIVFRKNLLRKVAWAPWSKLVKKNLLTRNKIVFPDIYIAEDMDFSCKVIYYAKKITCAEEYLYNYNLREGSLMSYTKAERRIENYFESAQLMKKFLENVGIYKKYHKEFIYFKLYNYAAIYGVMYYSKEKIDKEKYRNKIRGDDAFSISEIIGLGMLDTVIVAAILIKLRLFNPAFKIRESFRIISGRWGKRNN
jgi:glycosyltransferase involved in cell wall biosynthesis